MPRRARMYIPGLPYHVVQRGNNREAFLSSRRTISTIWSSGRKSRDAMVCQSMHTA
jgi:REP element-mobilizing transposase RayT